jgi:hypothetical protein
LDVLLAEYHSLVVGSTIRGQVVESVSLEIDTLDGPQWDRLRYFLSVHFREPDVPENMASENTMLRWVFWDTSHATVKLDAGEIRDVLSCAKQVEVDRWVLSDEEGG